MKQHYIDEKQVSLTCCRRLLFAKSRFTHRKRNEAYWSMGATALTVSERIPSNYIR